MIHLVLRPRKRREMKYKNENKDMEPVEDDGETESRGLVVVGASVHRVCLSRCSSGSGRSLNQQSSNLFHWPP